MALTLVVMRKSKGEIALLIDGVFSGGGLKGFALVGAYQLLEEKGYSFRRVAGTSAGAILASFIAAGYTGKEIEQLLDEQDFQSLLDPRKTILPFVFVKWLRLYWQLGLYQGKALEKWFMEKLAAKDVYTFGDLPKGSLKIVASDLTNGKMMVLPDDLETYGLSGDSFSVAHALRMSCGIPFFFEPVQLKAKTGEKIIVDGGVLSNFPLWLFDDDAGKRERPVLGIKLSHPQEDMPANQINNALDLFGALFSTMKDAHDERYISRKHEKNIIFIPVEDASATDFNMDDEKKEALMQSGRNSTKRFLKTW